MYYILYNPLSSNGKSLKQLDKLKKQLDDEQKPYILKNIIDENDYAAGLVKNLSLSDTIIIVGGDGTLHHYVNYLAPYNIQNDILLYKGGTGNDFSRDFKGKLIEIKKYITDLPSYEINGKKEFFLNGTGFGVDGEVCHLVNSSKGDKKGIQYFKNAVKAFKEFKKFDLEVICDGVRYNYRNCWFATVMNGKYFGGGMRLSPESERLDDTLELVVVHSLNLARLLTIFPLIFIGCHMKFKDAGIAVLKGKKFELRSSIENTLQTDGEVCLNVKEFKVER